ncbi:MULTISPECIES: tyrosine-type recombinase/integrase [Ramlibacter]|uniref:Tyrosine-type recombinase/integrase n=1 Tax=Ramlibacter pinisoli TaxID=2682844 RepID=A0A6N8J279_9BURK|nr:integrase [Ramlibacter sp. CGMCC 1.13660]MBA2962929.1 site-specific integrase [Ramlibacter sp. CGMCC 1.13660]MVQ32872.1 tyrosine-type recombinase/integrase [Ramlibacter pinisoli]
MASIRKRGSAWQARVTRKGFPDETASFKTKSEALEWCRSIETGMDAGRYIRTKEAGDTPLAELLRRYRETVTPLKRGAHDEAIRLKAFERPRFAKLSLLNVTPKVIAAFRDERLGECSPATVIRDLAVLSSIFNHARREWGVEFPNPVQLVRKPVAPAGRDRTLSVPEEERLLAASAPTGRRNPLLHPLVLMALETAMRRGELLSLRWEHVHLNRRCVFLPQTKNGTSRWVPLSTRTLSALEGLHRAAEGLVFPIAASALDKCFRRACARAGIMNFRFPKIKLLRRSDGGCVSATPYPGFAISKKPHIAKKNAGPAK